MALRFAELMFTPTVKTVQEEMGSRGSYERMEEPDAPARDRLGDGECAFIAARDTFYMATANEDGWPYVQHRGGPPGFLKVLDERTLGFADYSGNRQYVSVGNLMTDDRVSLFLIDYPAKRRLKILARVRFVDARREPDIIARLRDDNYDARIERGMIFDLEGFDWNCPQHITPRYTQAQIDEATAPLIARLTAAERRIGASLVAPLGQGPLALVVTGIKQLTPRVRSYEFRSVDDLPLPIASAGSHLTVPVALADGTTTSRTYSISSDPARTDHYEIAVLREDEGRGGSRAMHQTFALGQQLHIDPPRNAFSLHDDDRPAVLIAGGIGITPLRAMAATLRATGRDYALHYAARSRAEASYADEIAATDGSAATFYLGNHKLDVRALLASVPDDAIIYTCGPDRMIDAILAAAAELGWSDDRIRFERFVAPPVVGTPFDIVLAASGRRLHVPADRSVLDVLEADGQTVASSCRQGVCATCVVTVRRGQPDHRDFVFSADDHAAGCFATCVSRSTGDELVLDL
jgi:ferredoxin-NADP reductase/predicted pyridoxine 5'-phosphate oxidase superfamily flavin-nucleotide-binding protein